ncbi:MAG: RraA family protein [candidate division Zixibacteria bacterium]|nr:RraA family protein [candidate division Zixibacteria bacterium]
MGRLSADLLAELSQYDSATVFNAVVKVRGKDNEDYTGPDIRYLLPEFGAFAGYAVTCEATPLDPAPSPLPWDAYYDLLDQTPGPIVAVMKDTDVRPRRGAIFGDGMAHLHRALGVVGAITDGCVRDLVGIRTAGLPIFGYGTVPGHGPFQLRRVGEPVVVGQITVSTGDLLFADVDGVVKIPGDIAEQVVQTAAEIRRWERGIFDSYRAPDFDWETYKANRKK